MSTEKDFSNTKVYPSDSCSPGSCNGIAFWTEYNFLNSPSSTVSCGPATEVELHNFINWDMYTRQGVHLFWQPVEATSDEITAITCHVHNNDGIISFNFT